MQKFLDAYLKEQKRIKKKGKQKHNNDEDLLKIKANSKLLKTNNWAPKMAPKEQRTEISKAWEKTKHKHAQNK